MSMRRRLGWALLLSFVLAAPVLAGAGVWTPVSDPWTPTAQVLVDPADPETLYALVVRREATNVGALWKSTDGGATWRSIQEGIGAPVDLLAFDPLQPGRLYTMQSLHDGSSRLWVSEDGGETWAVRFTLPPSASDLFQQIVASPLHEGTLYAWGQSGSVYRSTDGAATWQKRSATVASSVETFAEPLLHHPTRDRLEVFSLEAFLVSDDGGLTWQTRGSFNGAGFRDVTRNATAPDRLYAIPAGSDVCLVRSDDDGAQWRELPSPALPRDIHCSDVAVDLHDPDLVRVVASGPVGEAVIRTLFTSRDGGATWSHGSNFPAIQVVPTPADPETLFAGFSSPILLRGIAVPGIYKSTDDGQSWIQSSHGIASGDLRRGLVALSGLGRDSVLVGLLELAGSQSEGHLVRLVERGTIWQLIPPPFYPSEDFWSLAAGGRILYVVHRNDNRILRSLDRGLTWTRTSELPTELGPLFADPYLPGRVFMPSHDYTVPVPGRTSLWRTQNAGDRWARRDRGLPGDCSILQGAEYCPRLYALTSDPRDHNRVLLAFGGDGVHLPGAEVVVSTDGGTAWHRAAQSPPSRVTALAAVGPRGNFLAGTAEGKIFQSVDGGEHWTAFGPGLPVPSPVLQLLRQPHGAWYAVTEDSGIFRSADGRTWSDISAGLPDLAAPVVVLDPRRPDHLFAAVRGQGLWSWTP